MTAVTSGSAGIIKLPMFTSKKQLAFNMWLPFDWDNNAFGYWMAYAYSTTACIISAVAV